MKKNYIYILLLVFVTVATSCEKIIEIDVDDADQQLVVEGVLNNDGSNATVTITKSVGLSDDNIFPAVNNAFVILSDASGVIDTLTLSTPGVYQSDAITTTAGTTYQLSVTVDGKTYTAFSTMPELIPLDSVGVDSSSFAGNVNYFLVPYHYDPPIVENSYRYKFFINFQADKLIYVDNDDYTDGRYVSRPFFLETEMKSGDIVTVEMYGIDPSVYLYWYSLSQSGGGPDASATPANPVSNFSGGCLGYFSAQTRQVTTVVIP